MEKIDANETDYLYIKESQIPNSGNGLFTSIPIYKDEIISLFKGEILTLKESERRASNGSDQYFICMLDGTIMDSMHIDCFAKYANDVEGIEKTLLKTNSKITIDEQGNVCVVAKRKIKSGEEIFCNYGKKYWAKHHIQTLLNV